MLSVRAIDSGEMDRCVGAQCARNGGDDPCPYCRCTDCSGHHPEDANSFDFGEMVRSVRIECFGDEEDEGDELCPYCMSTDCAGHTPEDIGPFGFGKMARWVGNDLPEPAVMIHTNERN